MKKHKIKCFSALYFKQLPIKIHTATAAMRIATTAIATPTAATSSAI